MITIESVGKATFGQFLALPRRLYRDMIGFTPPLDLERRELLHPKHSAFFERGSVSYFLARRGGDAVGRISAQVDPLYSRGANEDVAFFGCLDAVDDAEVVDRLLDTARGWARARGKARLQGPYTLSVNMEPGLMIEGQAAGPMLLAPWHPPHLAHHLEAQGLVKIQDVHYYGIDLDSVATGALAERLGTIAPTPTLRVRGMRLDRLEDEAALACALYNDGWARNWGFVPLAPSEIHAVLVGLKPLLHSDIGLVVEIDDQPVAVAVVLPNVAEMAADLGGAPSLLGWAKFATRILRRSCTSGRLAILGIASAYQGLRGAGIMIAMLDEMRRRAARHGLRSIEAGWILESNKPMQRFVNSLGLPRTRTYRIYEQPCGVSGMPGPRNGRGAVVDAI